VGRNPHSRHVRPVLVANAATALLTVATFAWLDTPAMLSMGTRHLLCRLFGGDVVNAGMPSEPLLLGTISLPWSEACSGMSTLWVLVGVVLWTNWDSTPTRLLALLVSCVPLTLALNLARVALIAVYRFAFYPAWEGEHLHYLFGLLTIAPAVMLITRGRYPARVAPAKLAYLVCVLALASAEFDSPGGMWVLGASVGVLLPILLDERPTQVSPLAAGAWLLLALLIGAARAESLWLPWLLVSPWFQSWQRFSWTTVCLLPGTVPMIALQWPVQVLVLTAGSWRTWQLWQADLPDPQPAPDQSTRWLSGGVLTLALPFLAAPLLSLPVDSVLPPSTVMRKPMGPGSFLIRAVGQTPSISVMWFGSGAAGRHHALQNCLRFKGVSTQIVQHDPLILETPTSYLRESFVLDGRRIDSYRAYALRCLPPFTSSGAHLIVEGRKDRCDLAVFAQESEEVLRQLDLTGGTGRQSHGSGGQSHVSGRKSHGSGSGGSACSTSSNCSGGGNCSGVSAVDSNASVKSGSDHCPSGSSVMMPRSRASSMRAAS